jgi:biotin carboxylase
VIGYQDSGADIAYCLSKCPVAQVLTPVGSPKPLKHGDWCFPDSEEGLLSALDMGATHLWANTILFASHPLQTSINVAKFENTVNLIGQPPLLVEQYDDKELVNNLLRKVGGFNMPLAWTIREMPDLEEHLASLSLPYPVVGKPVRGRGSHGVKVCHSLQELLMHSAALLKESPTIMLEEFLSGEEATVTVMPPTKGMESYWALPVVRRFNHQLGIAPYNGVVAVTANSEAVVGKAASEPAYIEVAQQCERAARLLGTTAPIRIDVRRYNEGVDSKFALFDVNMKPVSIF